MLLEKIKKFWKAGLAETIKDTAIPSGARVPFGSKKETLKDTFMPFGRKEDKNKILTLFVITGTAILVMTGCGNGLPEVPDFRETVEDNEMYLASEDDFDDAENIAAVYRDIYDKAAETNTLLALMEWMKSIPCGDSNIWVLGW